MALSAKTAQEHHQGRVLRSEDYGTSGDSLQIKLLLCLFLLLFTVKIFSLVKNIRCVSVFFKEFRMKAAQVSKYVKVFTCRRETVFGARGKHI